MPKPLRAILPPFLGSALLMLSSLATAANSILQVDLLMVEQPSWVRSKDVSSWPVRPQELQDAANPDDLANRSGFAWRPGPESSFAEIAEKMRSQGYKPLLLTSYRFPQTRLRRATSVSIREGDPLVVEAHSPYAADGVNDGSWFDQPQDRNPDVLPPINGWIRSWVETYLFVEFDLARYLPRPERRQQIEEARAQQAINAWSQNETTSNVPAQSIPGIGTSGFTNAFASPNTEDYSDASADIWPREAVEMHRVAERKRVHLNEIHYFDHPQIGVLVRVTEPSSVNPAESPQ